MKDQIQNLIALQEIDTRFEESAERKRKLPELVETARQPFQAAQAGRDAVKQEFDGATKDRKTCEQDLAVQEQAISKLQDRAVKGEIKTNKEYQAHLFEIELAKKKKGEIEERLLLLMEKVDVLKKEVAQAESAAKDSERRFNDEKAALEGSVGVLEAELVHLRQRRQALVATLEPSLFRTYERLRASRKGQALAGLNKDGSCLVCRLQVEPQVVAEVKRGTAILTCSNCQRIFYWSGEPAQFVTAVDPSGNVEAQEAAETTE